MCTFCKILNRQLDGYFVYEDEHFAAFLDKYPVAPGHTLVVPKEHFENYLETPEEVLSGLAKVVKIVSIAVKDAVKADGVRILTNVGESAGQVIFHLHVHIIPTWANDYPEIFKYFTPRREMSSQYYELLQKVINESVKMIKDKYNW